MMNPLLHKLRIISEASEEKNYLDKEIGILYNIPKHLLYIGSNLDSTLNYTLTNVFEDEVEEIVKSLKGHNPKQWKAMLQNAGYNVMPH